MSSDVMQRRRNALHSDQTNAAGFDQNFTRLIALCKTRVLLLALKVCVTTFAATCLPYLVMTLRCCALQRHPTVLVEVVQRDLTSFLQKVLDYLHANITHRCTISISHSTTAIIANNDGTREIDYFEPRHGHETQQYAERFDLRVGY